jgi:hypothetical protein
VQSRFLLQSSGGSETGVSIYRDSGDTNRSVHLYANFFDWSGGSNKVWWSSPSHLRLLLHSTVPSPSTAPYLADLSEAATALVTWLEILFET